MAGLVRATVLSAVLVLAMSPASISAGADCQFVLGFRALHDLIPQIVGDCLENEHTDPFTGNSLQSTTNGLLVWRKADNSTAFTNGQRTEVLGPFGLQTRLNTERFSWEIDSLLPALLNAQFTLPLVQDQETTFRLSNGVFNDPTQHVMVTLDQMKTAFGDLNGDGTNDAVAILAVSFGGSGTFVWAVPVLNINGIPVQVDRELLGDRVVVNNVSIANRKATLDLLVHGPTDPECCPTQRLVKTLESIEQTGIG
jgi:hypothetical protein